MKKFCKYCSFLLLGGLFICLLFSGCKKDGDDGKKRRGASGDANQDSVRVLVKNIAKGENQKIKTDKIICRALYDLDDDGKKDKINLVAKAVEVNEYDDKVVNEVQECELVINEQKKIRIVGGNISPSIWCVYVPDKGAYLILCERARTASENYLSFYQFIDDKIVNQGGYEFFHADKTGMSVATTPEQLEISNDGFITNYKIHNVLQTCLSKEVYHFSDDGKIVKDKEEKSYEPEYVQNNKITLKKEIVLRNDPNDKKDTFTMKPQKFTIVKSKSKDENEEHNGTYSVYIKGEEGTSGWLRVSDSKLVDNGYVDYFDQTYFEGLLMYG